MNECNENDTYPMIDCLVIPLLELLCKFDRLMDASHILMNVIHDCKTKNKFYQNCSLWNSAKKVYYYLKRSKMINEANQVMRSMVDVVINKS